MHNGNRNVCSTIHHMVSMETSMKGLIEGLKVYNPAPSKPLNLIYKKYFQTFKPHIHDISNMPDIRFVYKRFDIKDINGLAVFLYQQEDPAPFSQISTIRK